MFCHRCGTEITAETAERCINCHEPVIKIPASINDHNSAASPEPDQAADKNPSSISLDFGDDDEVLRTADPIDFLMTENQVSGENNEPEPAPEISDSYEDFLDNAVSGENEDFENNPDTETNAPSVSADGFETLLKLPESDKTDEESTGKIPESKPEYMQESGPMDPVAAFSQNTAVKTEKKTVPPLLNVSIDDPNSGENIVATTKIAVEKPVNTETRGKQAGDSTAKLKDVKKIADPTNLDLTKIRQSSGVVFLSGNNLTFAGGMKVAPGDTIQVGDKSFDVKRKPKDRTNLYGILGSAVIAILITLYFLGAFSGGSTGSLVGIVAGGPNDRPLADQEVRLVETGKTVITNNAGFFIFDNIPSGIYTVEYLEDDEVIGEARSTVLGDNVTTITLKKKVNEAGDSRSSSIKPDYQSSAVSITPEKAEKSESKEPGTLKISLNPQGVSAYLDGKTLGVGSNTYRVRPGKYLLSVKKKGYETQSKRITVRSDQEKSYSFSLKKSPAKSARKTTAESAYESELAGSYHEALRLYDKILDKDPGNIPALLGKGRCFAAQDMRENAITCFMQAANMAGESGEAELQYEAYSGIIKARPNTFTAYMGRGELQYSRGEYQDAAGDFQKVIEIDHRNLKAYYLLGDSYYKSKKYSDALVAFLAAEELHFADPKAQVCLAKTYYKLGDKKNAKKAYEKFQEMASYSTSIEYKNDPEWKNVLKYLEVEN